MEYKEILLEAEKNAVIAFKNCIPTPVIWQQEDLLGNVIGKPSEPDLEGDCGGAYITNINGRDPFVKWCKTNEPDLIHKGVYKGYDLYLRIKDYNGQSAEKRKAYAEAFAKVLNGNNIKCNVKAYLT